MQIEEALEQLRISIEDKTREIRSMHIDRHDDSTVS